MATEHRGTAVSAAIGVNIKLWRVRKNITQIDLAKKTGLSQSYFSRLEKGEENPTLDTLDRVSRALGISLSRLLKEDEEQKAEQAA